MVHQIETLENHIIICGYGPVGENLHRNLSLADVDVVVLEMNPDTVKSLLSRGIKALFADARDVESLNLAQLKTARGIAITFPHVEVACTLAKHALEAKQDIIVHARCKFLSDVAELEKNGVHHVMLDEEQSGRAMIRSVMQSYEAHIEETWEA